MEAIQITERGYRQSSFGRVLQLKIFTADYRPLGWMEVWEAFTTKYPGRWAVQCFPPADQLVNGKSVYHLFVLNEPPQGLNIREG